MRRSPLFRRNSALAVFLILLVFVIPFAHASTYVGYGSSQADAASCSLTFCLITNTVSEGWGTIVQAPFTGTIVSASVQTGSTPPDHIAIITFTGGTPATTQDSGGTHCVSNSCFFVNSGQAFTLGDFESVGGFGSNCFCTVNLANPVSVTSGAWTGVLWLHTAGAIATNSFNMGACGGSSGGCGSFGTTVSAIAIDFGSTNPAVGNNFNTENYGTGGPNNPSVSGVSFTAQGSGGQTVTVTQCYGNCGTPAVTLANTNSTHSINFNQTITLLYEFQSNLNGFIQNVTVSLAKTYIGNVFLGVYQIPQCNLGLTPFTAACPGLLQQSQSQLAIKGKNSMTITNLGVSNGQWVGITVTATQSGLDLNDTNTNVPLFQTNEGRNPPAIQAATTFSGASKVGLWAWIRGNVVTGGPPTTPPSSCQSFATIDCWVPALINGSCSNSSPQCQTSAALFWILVLSIIFEVALAYCFNTVVPNIRIPFGEMFLFIILIWTFILTGLALLFVWVPVFFFMVASILFSKHTGRYF